MKFDLLDLFSFSIGIAAILGWVRYKNIHPSFYPFIYLCWVAFANELLNYTLIYTNHHNTVSTTIYILFESLLIAWLMRNCGVFGKKRNLFKPVLAVLFVLWGLDVLFLSGFTHTITYYFMVSSFLIVIMSMICIGQRIGLQRGFVFKDPVILISMTFILYFTMAVLVGVFTIYGFKGSTNFRQSLYWILVYTNLTANLIYALAILWMPKKIPYTLPY